MISVAACAETAASEKVAKRRVLKRYITLIVLVVGFLVVDEAVVLLAAAKLKGLDDLAAKEDQERDHGDHAQHRAGHQPRPIG